MSFFVFPCPLDVRHHLEVACLMSATVFLSPVVNLRVHLMFAYLVFFDFRVHSMSDITFGGVLDVRHHLWGRARCSTSPLGACSMFDIPCIRCPPLLLRTHLMSIFTFLGCLPSMFVFFSPITGPLDVRHYILGRSRCSTPPSGMDLMSVFIFSGSFSGTPRVRARKRTSDKLSLQGGSPIVLITVSSCFVFHFPSLKYNTTYR